MKVGDLVIRKRFSQEVPINELEEFFSTIPPEFWSIEDVTEPMYGVSLYSIEDNGKILGLAHILDFKWDWSNSDFSDCTPTDAIGDGEVVRSIVYMATKGGYQFKGLGYQLIQRIIQESPFEKLAVYSEEGAVSFWKKQGFTPVIDGIKWMWRKKVEAH